MSSLKRVSAPEHATAYSDIETSTGDIWIDGQIIYRRTWFGFADFVNGASLDFDLDIKIEAVVSIRGSAKTDANRHIPIAGDLSSSIWVEEEQWGRFSVLKVNNTSGFTWAKWAVSIDYTKEPDPFNSTYGPKTSGGSSTGAVALSSSATGSTGGQAQGIPPYTLSEHLTGALWVDGLPIYRKVFQGTVDGSGNIDILHNISTIRDYRNFEALVVYPAGGGSGDYITDDASWKRHVTDTNLTASPGAAYANLDFFAILSYTKD